jgi:hypothetical protein
VCCVVMRVVGCDGCDACGVMRKLCVSARVACVRPTRPCSHSHSQLHPISYPLSCKAGVPLRFIDTPGLEPAAAATARNRAVLRSVRGAYRWHTPDYVFYVDRRAQRSVVCLVVRPVGASVPRFLLARLSRLPTSDQPHVLPSVPLTRLDAGRPSLGELGLLGLIGEALGPGVWRNTMALLTHAHAARAAFGCGSGRACGADRVCVACGAYSSPPPLG